MSTVLSLGFSSVYNWIVTFYLRYQASDLLDGFLPFHWATFCLLGSSDCSSDRVVLFYLLSPQFYRFFLSLDGFVLLYDSTALQIVLFSLLLPHLQLDCLLPFDFHLMFISLD